MSQMDFGFSDLVNKPKKQKIARNTDPVTSHVAAVDVRPKLRGMRAEFVRLLQNIKAGTAQEVAQGAEESKRESIRKRAKELIESGDIKVIGYRNCRITGKMAQVYGISK